MQKKCFGYTIHLVKICIQKAAREQLAQDERCSFLSQYQVQRGALFEMCYFVLSRRSFQTDFFRGYVPKKCAFIKLLFVHRLVACSMLLDQGRRFCDISLLVTCVLLPQCIALLHVATSIDLDDTKQFIKFLQ